MDVGGGISAPSTFLHMTKQDRYVEQKFEEVIQVSLERISLCKCNNIFVVELVKN